MSSAPGSQTDTGRRRDPLPGRPGPVTPHDGGGADVVLEPVPSAPPGAAGRTDRRARRAPGLRARASFAAALGALVVTLSLSSITYALVRNYLLSQRDDLTLRQAYANARVVRDLLSAPDPPLNELLSSLRGEPGSQSLVWYQQRWYGSSASRYPEALPAVFRDRVTAERTGRQRFVHDGKRQVAVSVAMPAVAAVYVEIFPLDSLGRTLGALRTSLGLASMITAVGGAALGWWTSRRVMRPLSRVSSAADAIAHGGFDTRLAREGDPDLERLVASFNDMADALQARVEREARFASDVSHELRTPLAALTASAEVLSARREDLPDRSRQALDILLNQLRRFDRMVLDLLEISRIDAGATDVHLEPVGVRGYLERVLAANAFPQVPLHTSPEFEGLEVPLDRRRVERILANLLLNARAHGGGPVSVTAELDRTTRPSPTLVLRIADAGPGVAPGERERIFERFARGASTRARQGTGLGLAIVAEHVRVLRGKVHVEDTPGGGATFVVELPVTPSPVDPA